MKRKFVISFLSTVLVFSVLACGESQKEETTITTSEKEYVSESEISNVLSIQMITKENM